MTVLLPISSLLSLTFDESLDLDQGMDSEEAAQLIAKWRFPSVRDFQQSFAWYDLPLDNEVGLETVKAVRHVLINDGRLSPSFHMNEFRSKGNGFCKTHRELLRGLEEVRAMVGSIGIVSGYRDPDHNRRVGGASNSQHVFGTAADVSLPYDAVRNVKRFSGIGCSGFVGGRVLHVDVRHAGPNNTTGGTPSNPTIWVY